LAEYDVIVVGAGNAACAAAVSARESGAKRILVLEKASKAMRGGNTHYSGGLFRIVFNTTEELLPLVPNVEDKAPGFLKGVKPYTQADFKKDLMRVTDNRTDPELSEILIGRSYDTIRWIKDRGVPMEAAISLSAIRIGNEIKWPTGAVIRAEHEGVGLSEHWFEILEKRGIEVRYETRATELAQDKKGRVNGVIADGPDGYEEISSKAVVLGCGGFEANAEWRARYLGRPWDHAKVRGTRFNTGDGLRMAMAIGALPCGNWTGCHSTPINAEAPAYGDRKLTDKTNRLSYPFGVLVNRQGERFFDEGEDFQWYTYAKLGGIILNQPGSIAYQFFDSKVLHLLEGRYKTSRPFQAQTLRELVEQLDLDRSTCLRTLEQYNEAASNDGFDPTVLDRLATKELSLPKSNWALRLDRSPFVAYPVTGGITFTFGGVRITPDAQVVDVGWRPIPGLYACGEMVGGLFHTNYPGGTGLVSGAVFGKIAGASAAAA
jgi:tricarballylate dehydrogenase